MSKLGKNCLPSLCLHGEQHIPSPFLPSPPLPLSPAILRAVWEAAELLQPIPSGLHGKPGSNGGSGRGGLVPPPYCIPLVVPCQSRSLPKSRPPLSLAKPNSTCSLTGRRQEQLWSHPSLPLPSGPWTQ